MTAVSTTRLESGSVGLVDGGVDTRSLLSKILADHLERPTVASAPSVAGARLEVLRDGPGLSRLAPHWDDLLMNSAVRTPFMSWDWSEIWWQQFEPEYRAVFGAAWANDGQLLALVPFVIGPGQTSTRRRLRQLSFFAGLGEVVAEGLDCMALPGQEGLIEQLMSRIFEEIQGEWDTAHFGFVDETSPFFPQLYRALQKFGADGGLTNRQASPVIDLSGKSWESYLMERSSNFRKKFRRITAAAASEYDMKFREPAGGHEVSAFVEELFSLHGGRWTEEQSLFLRPRARAFHHELAKRWVGDRRMVLLVMDFLGEPVAANYGFRDGAKMWDYQGGWKVEHIELSPAKLLNAENIRRAMDCGVTEIDMLPGDPEYKSKWTSVFREVADLEAINPHSVRARVFQSIRRVKRAVGKLFPGGTTES